MEHIDTSSAAGKFTLGVLALLAEMERNQIGERTKLGMDQIAREGRARSLRLPFGYRLDGSPDDTRVSVSGDRRKLVEHDGEQRILARMLAMRARGDGAYLIAKALNGEGVGNPRTRGLWSTGTVAAILRTHNRRAALALRQQSCGRAAP